MEGIWGFVVIGGPILFAVILLWAITHNRQNKRQERRTEAATKELYVEQSEEDRREEHAGMG